MLRAGVVPGELQLAGRIERDVVRVVEIVVRVVIDVVLVQRATNAEARAGRDQVAHAGVAAVSGVGRVVHGQRVVVAAALPVVDERDAVGDAVVGERLEVGGDVGERAAPDVEHDLVRQEIAPGRRRVGRIGQHLGQVPGRGEEDALAQRNARAVGQGVVVGLGPVVRRGGRGGPVEQGVDEQPLLGKVVHRTRCNRAPRAGGGARPGPRRRRQAR